MTDVVKIVVVGPKECGKTTTCQLVAGATPSREYDPTAGVRVQTCERRVGMRTVRVDLWDCSGDLKYQTCFPAMADGMDGLLIVYDPDEPGREAELEKWHDAFALSATTTRPGEEDDDVRLKPSQCLVLGARRTSVGNPRAPATGKLAKLPNVIVDVGGGAAVESRASRVGDELDKMLARVVAAKREREENALLR